MSLTPDMVGQLLYPDYEKPIPKSQTSNSESTSSQKKDVPYVLVSQIVKYTKQEQLWDQTQINYVLQKLKGIYSSESVINNNDREKDDKLKAWFQIFGSLQPSITEEQVEQIQGQAPEQIQQGATRKSKGQLSTIQTTKSTTIKKSIYTFPMNLDQIDLSWFTSDDIAIDAKRAVIRAMLTIIRLQNPNTLNKARYVELTGKGTWADWRQSWKTYIYESFKNSKELQNDTKKDNYLDQVITLFLLFVRNILGIDKVDSVGKQRDSRTERLDGELLTEYAKDLLPTGYGSTGYSKQDDPEREAFVRKVTSQLADILSKDKSKIVVKETDEPSISFEINQKKVYYLAELANAFYQFMSAEMDKSGKLLTTKEWSDATTKGSYIQRQEEYNLGYLRQWFIRTRSIHPIISWLFQNYKEYMYKKIYLNDGWYKYSFMSDLLNRVPKPQLVKSLNNFIQQCKITIGNMTVEEIVRDIFNTAGT